MLSLSAHGADDNTSRPNTKNATPNNRTAAPRWIRRRRRVDPRNGWSQKEQSLQKDVDALVAERRERNADFASSSSSSSGALKSAFESDDVFDIKPTPPVVVVVYVVVVQACRRDDGGATIEECNCTIPHVLHRIRTPRHGCSLGVVSMSNWKYPVLVC